MTTVACGGTESLEDMDFEEANAEEVALGSSAKGVLTPDDWNIVGIVNRATKRRHTSGQVDIRICVSRDDYGDPAEFDVTSRVAVYQGNYRHELSRTQHRFRFAANQRGPLCLSRRYYQGYRGDGHALIETDYTKEIPETNDWDNIGFRNLL